MLGTNDNFSFSPSGLPLLKNIDFSAARVASGDNIIIGNETYTAETHFKVRRADGHGGTRAFEPDEIVRSLADAINGVLAPPGGGDSQQNRLAWAIPKGSNLQLIGRASGVDFPIDVTGPTVSPLKSLLEDGGGAGGGKRLVDAAAGNQAVEFWAISVIAETTFTLFTPDENFTEPGAAMSTRTLPVGFWEFGGSSITLAGTSVAVIHLK